jgi:nitrogenase molybdenum-iron protein alpha/beta subunit
MPLPVNGNVNRYFHKAAFGELRKVNQPAALPSPYRLVMTSGYAGYRGGLRLIEDIYNQALSTYR